MAAKGQKADAEVEESAEDDAPQKGKGKKKFSLRLPSKMVMMIAAGVLVLGGAGAGAYFFFSHPKQEKPKIDAPKPATFVDLPDVLVNLSNAGNANRTQYLKVKIVLEVPDPAQVPQIQPLMPRIMDAFQTYLRELRPTDLDGSAGLYRLKEELTRRVNTVIAPNHVTAVLFKEIVVQ